MQRDEHYIGRRKSMESWRFIKRSRTEKRQRIIATVQEEEEADCIATLQWEEHYQSLSVDGRIYPGDQDDVLLQGGRISFHVEQLMEAVKLLRNGCPAGPEEILAELIKQGYEKLFQLLKAVFVRYHKKRNRIKTTAVLEEHCIHQRQCVLSRSPSIC